MKLPSVDSVTSPTARTLLWWDLREYFSTDPKDFWTIHYRNRLDTIQRAATEFIPPGGAVLDIGCAQATASILLAERGYRVTAVDANPECLLYAKQRHEHGDCIFICIDALKGDGVEALRREFDGILLGEVLEHVPQPGRLIRICRQKLRDGGVLLITTPNGASPHNRRFHPYGPEMEEPERASLRSGLGGRDTHLFNFRLPQLLALLGACGLKIRRQEYLNSYVINPVGLHRLFTIQAVERLNRACARVPVLAQYSTMTLFVVAQKTAV